MVDVNYYLVYIEADNRDKCVGMYSNDTIKRNISEIQPEGNDY